MPWGAAIGAAATIIGSDIQSNAAEKGTKKGIAAQQQAQAQSRQDLEPWRQSGQQANMRLDQLMAGDYSGFENSPDYLYAREQMQKAVERGAAARGSLYSGGTNVDLARELGGLASQNLGNYRNAALAQSQLGQAAAAGQASGALSTGANIANLANQGANAQGDIWGNAVNQLGQTGAGYFGRQQGLGSGWGGGAGSTMQFGSENPVTMGSEYSLGTSNPFRGSY